MDDMIESHAGTRRIVTTEGVGAAVGILGATVVVESGPDHGLSARLLSTSLLVGTDPRSDLRLTDPSVSRTHAVLTLVPAGLQLTDRGSTNGTWIGPMKVAEVTLSEDSRVRVGQTVLHVRLRRDEFVAMPSASGELCGIIGRTEPMRRLFTMIEQLARVDVPVAIVGETGTGKDLVARALHQAGPRADRPFVVVDAAALVPGLIRSEIFGHEKGAFTGATESSCGALEAADGGTVFFDEIGEIPLELQPALLRALETREVTPLGSRRPRAVEFRLVSATNRDLKEAVAAGRFRADLLYRLSGVTLQLPALRNRIADIPLLIQHFLKLYSDRSGTPVPRMDPEVLDLMHHHPWPGNARQLRHVVEAACVLAPDGAVDPTLVRGIMSVSAAPHGDESEDALRQLPETIEAAEREVIARVLRWSGGSRTRTAQRLGISPNTLTAKIRKYRIADNE